MILPQDFTIDRFWAERRTLIGDLYYKHLALFRQYMVYVADYIYANAVDIEVYNILGGLFLWRWDTLGSFMLIWSGYYILHWNVKFTVVSKVDKDL